MKSKFFGSLALASVIATGANAIDVSAFGHVGTAYGFQTYGSATGRAGIEVGMGPVGIGVGGAGAIPYVFGKNATAKRQLWSDLIFDTPSAKEWYNWISDLYFRVDTSWFSFIGGRYDITAFFRGKDGKAHSGVDWFFGQNEGASFKFDSKYFSWWGIYSYESMGFGDRNPDRLGNNLMGFDQFRTYGHYASTGFDINIKETFYIDPFVTYLFNPKDKESNILQAGLKLQLNLGKGVFKSKTIFRGMYQQRKTSSDVGKKWDTAQTALFWLDQEFLVVNLFKFGAGGYYVTEKDDIINEFGHSARFYGRNFLNVGNYFNANSSVWYAFAGVESKYFLLDLIYSWNDKAKKGSYQEISAIAQGNIYFGKNVVLGVGGGWLKSPIQEQAVAFVKLSF